MTIEEDTNMLRHMINVFLIKSQIIDTSVECNLHV